jgi:hypothetical protein
MTLTTVDPNVRAQAGLMDETEQAARPRRRTFTRAEKLGHLDAYDALPKGSDDQSVLVGLTPACTTRSLLPATSRMPRPMSIGVAVGTIEYL